MIAEEPEPAAGEVGGEEGAINISDDESLTLHVQQSGPFGDSGTGEGGRGRGRVVQGPQGSRPPVQETPAPVSPTVAGAVSSGSTPTLRSVVTTIYVGVPSRNSLGTRVSIVRAEPSSTADSRKRCGEEINSGLAKQKRS